MKDSVDEHVATWSKELEWLDPVKEAIIARMHIVVRHSSQNRQQALHADDLILWQFKTLLMLRRLGPPYTASPSQLAATLGLTRGALSARLTTLEDLGLITRVLDSGDRRRVKVTLTPKGRRAVESTAGNEEQGEGRLLSALTEREKRTLANLLRKLVVAIETGRAG